MIVVVWLLIGLVVGLVLLAIAGLEWTSTKLTDRRALERIALQLEAERRMQAATHAALQAMRRAASHGEP